MIKKLYMIFLDCFSFNLNYHYLIFVLINDLVYSYLGFSLKSFASKVKFHLKYAIIQVMKIN